MCSEFQIRVGGKYRPLPVDIAVGTVFGWYVDTTHELNTMNVYVAGEHLSFKNVVLMAIQCLDLRVKYSTCIFFSTKFYNFQCNLQMDVKEITPKR